MREGTISTDTEPANLTVEEIRAAITTMPANDRIRLLKAARGLAAGTGMESKELLGEAVCRALDRTRTCRRDLPVLVFLIGAMKSIAWAAREAEGNAPAMESLDMTDMGGAVLQLPAPGRTVEEALVAREDWSERIEALQTLFADDEQALLVIMGDLDGLPATEIREMAGMDEKTLATVRRRIRRKIENAFPGGWAS